MTKPKGPIIWFGGKGMMTAKLLPLVPAHQSYVEVFGGGAALLFAKEPAPLEVYNDLNEGLVHFFKTLRDEKLFLKLWIKLIFTPHSRPDYLACRNDWQSESDPVERAYKWYVVARMSFGGNFGGSWGSVVSASGSRAMAATASRWRSVLEFLPYFHERIFRVQIEKADWRVILDRYDGPQVFFYLDPPYVPSTRKSGGYEHELSADDHRDLVKRILKLQGKVLLSGYPNGLYDPLKKAGWNYKEWDVICNAAGRTKAAGLKGKGIMKAMQPRTEAVWFNYPLPVDL